MLQRIEYPDKLPVRVQLLQIEEYPWHMHEDLQIIYALEGEIELKLTYARYRLTKNQIHFIHNDDIHGMKAITKNNLILILSFNVEYFLKLYPKLDSQVFTTRVNEGVSTYKRHLALKAHIFSIVAELYGQEAGYQERIRNLSLELIDMLYKDFRGFTIDRVNRIFEHTISHDKMRIDRINRVISYIYENYPYKMSLSAIAEEENINIYYLSHLFQRSVGDSFRNFVSMVRVEMSESELLTTTASIEQISHNVGFSNAKYYVENFKEWFGCHPKEYRQLYRNKILGRSPVRIKELPLERLNAILETYSSSPAFTGASASVCSATFDCKKAPVGPPLFKTPRMDFASFYQDYDSHKDCFCLLRNILRDPFAPLPDPIFRDSEGCRDGLFTLNGLPKPLYWLYQLLNFTDSSIRQLEPWYLILSNQQGFQILFFNADSEKSQQYEFHIFKLPGNYQAVESRLGVSHSCIELWKQLNFKAMLTEAEREQIRRMSAPKISFQILDSSSSPTYSAVLAPGDIAFTELKRL